jgi:glutathione S-transferase
VFEELEQCLLIAARRLSSRPYLVGERFTAADLTLASLMRPAVLVPYFRDHPRLRQLFEWRLRQLQGHQREMQVGYESALDDIRRRRGWALGEVRWLEGHDHVDGQLPSGIPEIAVARNDQRSVGRRPLLKAPLWYLRLRLTCGLRRTAYR